MIYEKKMRFRCIMVIDFDKLSNRFDNLSNDSSLLLTVQSNKSA